MNNLSPSNDPTTSSPDDGRLTIAISGVAMDQDRPKRFLTPSRVLALSGALALIALLIIAFVLSDPAKTLTVQVDNLTICEVQRGPFQEFIPLEGTVLPIKTVYLDVVQGGRVEEIYKEAGSLLNKGDKILRFDNRNLRSALMYNEALTVEQINQAQNSRLALQQNLIINLEQFMNVLWQVSRIEKAWKRDSTLYAKNALSQADYERTEDEHTYWIQTFALKRQTMRQDSLRTRAQLEQLDVSVARMQANLDTYRQDLENLALVAPISGQLTSLDAEVGQTKSSGQVIGQIDVMNAFKARTSVDEYYLTRLQTGLTATCLITGTPYRLTTKKLFPEIKNGKFDIDLEFTGVPPQDLHRGQSVQIRLQFSDSFEALIIPQGAFYQTTRGNWIFVVDTVTNIASARTIRIGRVNTEFFEVLGGLQAGEHVITSSYEALQEYQKLIIQR